jgi:alpha-glucosidase
MHDPALRDNPPAPPGRRTRPFDFQLHLYNQSHPDIAKFLERVRALTDSYGEARFTVAEVGGAEADAEMKLYTADDRRLNSAYNFDFLYAEVLTPTLVSRSLGAWRGGPDEGWPSWAFSNHDAPRSVTRWALPEHRDAAARMSLLLLACLRGNIFLYYGDELGLPQADIPFEALQGGFTHAKPWLPMPAEHRQLAVDVQEADPNSLLHFTRRIIALRKAHPVFQTGAFQPLASTGDVLAFERRDGAQRMLCVFNLSAEATTFPLPDGWKVIEAVNGWRQETGQLPGYAAFIAERG